MRLKRQVYCTLLIVVIIMLIPVHNAKAETQRYIALHDRVLSFDQNEVKLIKGRMVVPFEKMAQYLYADIVKTTNQIMMTKNGTSIAYDYNSKETTINQNIELVNPIRMIEGVLYIPIRFLGESTGFKVDYLSSILTARISSDSYPHMSNTEFIDKFIQNEKQKPIASIPSDKPIVYLTFDDGPNRNTSIHLQTLKEYNVKGTFFFTGLGIQNNPSLTRQTFEEGHYLGLHSMTHEKNKVYASSSSFMKEMKDQADLLKKLTGHTSTLVRAPYGSYPYVTPSMRGLMKNEGYKMWDWDVDTVDWKITEANYMQIVKNVQTGVEKARLAKDKHIVVLLHDRVQTSKALPRIIEWLQKEGYSIQPYRPELHVTQNFWKDKAL